MQYHNYIFAVQYEKKITVHISSDHKCIIVSTVVLKVNKKHLGYTKIRFGKLQTNEVCIHELMTRGNEITNDEGSPQAAFTGPFTLLEWKCSLAAVDCSSVAVTVTLLFNGTANHQLQSPALITTL